MLKRIRQEIDRWRALFGIIPQLVSLLWQSSPLLAAGWIVLGVLSGCAPSINLLLIKAVVDRLPLLITEGYSRLPAVAPWALLWAVTVVLTGIVTRINRLLEDHLRERAVLLAKQKVLELAARVPLEVMEESGFYDQLQRATTATEGQMVYTLRSLVAVVQTGMQLASVMILLAANSAWLIPMLAISTVPVAYKMASAGFQRWQLSRRRTPWQRKMAYLINVLTDVSAAKEIRIFGVSGYIQDQWANIAKAYIGEKSRLERKYAIAGFVGDSVNTLTYFAGLVLLAYMASIGNHTIGDFAMLTGALAQAQSTLQNLFTRLFRLQNDLVYMSDLSKFLGRTEQESSSGCVMTVASPYAIELEHCCFTYPGSCTPTIHDINLSIKPGECIALVGLNGSGKTTLAKLILGLYKPTLGAIRYNDTALNAIDLKYLRRQQSAVFQDFARYHFTVGKNIGLGQLDLNSNHAAISRAASFGGIDEVVEHLPNGYDTNLGKTFGGIDLSDGQWQKLAASRAFIRHDRALVCVFDEPTSALDPITETQILQRYSRLIKYKTTVLVSHRLGAARLADRIVVLADGRIVEDGSHFDLMAKNGVYANLFRTQAAWYQEILPA